MSFKKWLYLIATSFWEIDNIPSEVLIAAAGARFAGFGDDHLDLSDTHHLDNELQDLLRQVQQNYF